MSRNGYPHMVVDDYVDKLRAKRAERTRALAALKTREDALAYQAKLRQAIARSFGPKPKQVPLALEYTGTLQLTSLTRRRQLSSAPVDTAIWARPRRSTRISASAWSTTALSC